MGHGGTGRGRTSGRSDEVDLTALESEWAVLLKQAIGTRLEGSSIEEIAEKMGVSKLTARRRVREGQKAGTVECVGLRTATRMDGITSRNTTPVYRIVGKRG